MDLDTELARRNMVNNQIRNWDVVNPRVLDALSAVPRETFVPAPWRELAFADIAIPLGHGETMMKPVVEGRVLQAIDLKGDEEVLEIGTGSGFMTGLLAHLARHVTSVEYRDDFAATARANLESAGIDNVEIIVDEAVQNWLPARQYDVLVVTGAVASFPRRWAPWLKPEGRAFALVGADPAIHGVVLRIGKDGELAVHSLFETDLPYLLHAAPAPTFVL